MGRLSYKRFGRLPNLESSRTCLRFRYHSTLATITLQESSPVNIATDDWRKNLRGKDNEKLIGPRQGWWYTGETPSSENLKNLSNNSNFVSSLPQLLLSDASKEQVQNYFNNTWLMTEELFAGLKGEESFFKPPYHHLRHPMIFYYGHTATFYTNKLRVAGLVSNGLDAHFEDIFEVGVDEMRWDDISTRARDWPQVSEVHEYRKRCHQLVSNVIAEQFEGTKSKNITWDSPLWSLAMAIEHERIHVETSSVLMRELPLENLNRPRFFAPLHPSVEKSKLNTTFRPKVGEHFPENEMLAVDGMVVTLGRNTKAEKTTYGWDNEFGCRKVEVPDFKCSKFKVTNGEFFEFVQAGGYREQRHWTEDGWGWRRFRNQKWPTFWVQRGPAGSHDYGLRTIFEEVDMPWDAPVCVNYHEASAFCNWKSEKMGLQEGLKLRLITEAEFSAIRDEKMQLPIEEDLRNVDLSVAKGACDLVNNHLVSSSESSVVSYAPSEKGFYDVFGNVWEWTEDDFNFLEGYKVHPYYDDFSAPCFDGAHKMIMGGSFMSASDNGGNLFSRYHFRPHFHQHAGFRYVQPSKPEPNIKGEGVATFLGDRAEFSAKAVGTNMAKFNTYETESLLDQYVALHFGQDPSVVDKTIRNHEGRPTHALNFAQRCGDLLTKIFTGENGSAKLAQATALDVGCAVGGSSFKLAESFKSVVGMDYSASFVKKASEIAAMRENEVLRFKVPVEGKTFRDNIEVSIPSKSARVKTKFVTGDATKLNELKLGKFDAVLCANLLCRLPDPRKFLDHLRESVNPDGVVLFLSPYSWLEEFTPVNKWLSEPGSSSSEVLRAEMKRRGFSVVHEEDVPLVIREHERKYQYIVSHALGFKRID